MLTTFQKGVCALAVATSFLATSAQAEDHTVLIMDQGYFPATISVAEGDSVTFTNNSVAEHTLTGDGESWVSEPIPVDGSFQLDITDEVPATFGGPGVDGEVIEGSFSF